ncbi:hypothetical protein [Amycolatopsis alkalitolerans]|uniref:hypothetical protein n=1 Tax=Amycolatopsis alkalitolerans TaxID=2547244 RepID=UPI00135C990A|nr:hypothetical protein [Amycolatopsis alkalitolerans]
MTIATDSSTRSWPITPPCPGHRSRHGNPVNAEAYTLFWPWALSVIDVTTA